MATVIIQKRKTQSGIRYAVKYKDPVTRCSKHYGTYQRKKEAQGAANDLRAIIDSGRKPAPKKQRFVPLRFNEVAEILKAKWQKKLKRGKIKHKTLYDYSIWLKQLNKFFCSRLLCEITKTEVEDIIYETAQTSSHVNANKHLLTIKKLFKIGLEENAIIEDITAKIKSLKETERNNFLYPYELDNLITATKKTRGKHYMPAIIYLGAEHGASKQEILSLRWKDIQFNIGDGIIRFYRTKNEKERTEFLMPRTKESLLDWKTHLEYKRHRKNVTDIKSDYVFCRIDGTPIKNFNKAWWSGLRGAGIEDFHFHDLRHTFCSNLLMAGGDIKGVKEMIGHSDISMTDRYSHLSNIHKRNLQKLLSKHYSVDLAN